MGSDREHEAARTATAAASAKPGGPVGSVGATLGRYRLEHELGAGAMGVVHAAFDPDLERRIALKVLRVVAPTPEAKDRLLREARAMARLAHPNVVTVHEVGTANGRDFVAMELIPGEPLIDWLRSSRREPEEIIDAFLAAGRGLAAAHAAGIVHRDFKPHNVLRRRDGRIAVTDFGLAREAERQLPAALDATLPVDTPIIATSFPSAPAGLTSTGTLLGTPAYMAPEQWSGGAVTPATDQFAYCVALWEALAGERPYRGAIREELQRQVMRGPLGLDASKLPRRVRATLRRGLDPDPARRWPSMDALLEQIVRAKPRPGVAVASTGAVAVATVLVVAMRAGDAPVPACEAPSRDVTAVWSPIIATEVRTKTSEAHAIVLAATYHDWQAARVKVCQAPSGVRQAQLSCLDGVIERFDAVRLAYGRSPSAAAEQLQAQMIEPAICVKPTAAEVPRLKLAATPSVIAAYELYARSETDGKPSDAEIATFIGKPGTDPCARVIAALAFDVASKDVPRKRSVMGDATGADAQCGDERVHTDLLIQGIPYHSEMPIIGPRGQAALAQAQAAAVHVMQSDLAAPLALYRAVVAHQRGQWDEAFQLIDEEFAGYRARGMLVGQLHAVMMRNYLRLGRAAPSDLEAIAGDVQAWRLLALADHETEIPQYLDVQPWHPLALASHKAEIVRQLDVLAAMARFQLGDVPAAHAELIRLWQAQPRAEQSSRSRRITGEVVNTRGRPIAGATIAAGSMLSADSVGIGLPMFLARDDFRDEDLRTVTSDAAGRFVIENAAPAGVIMAQLGDLRSVPLEIADHVKLVLESTRSVSGKVDLRGTSYTRVNVDCRAVTDPSGRFTIMAPVAPDGSFTIAGAAVGALQIGALIRGTREYDEQIEIHTLPASSTAATGIRLGITSSSRVIDVIVRSTVTAPLVGARVTLVAGKHSIGSIGDLTRIKTGGIQSSPATPMVEQYVPRSMLDNARPGDLVAHFEHARPGDLTVCGASTAGDLLEPDSFTRNGARLSQLLVKCEYVGPDATLVELTVPPQPRVE